MKNDLRECKPKKKKRKTQTKAENPKKGNAGRKMFDGKDEQMVVGKLEAAFAFGATDLEACLYADIKKDSFYGYIKKHPKFADRKELLKETPILKARRAVIKGFDFDPNLALKYLERKKRKEFALRNDHTTDDKPLPYSIDWGERWENKTKKD